MKPEGEGWTRVDVTVESGSATSCLPKNKVPKGCSLKQLVEGLSSYTTTSSHKIAVQGGVTPEVAFEAGLIGPVQLNVLDPLKKALFSTSKMVDAGFRVVHQGEDGGSYMNDTKTGQKYPVHRKGGVFVMHVWMRKIPKPSSGNGQGQH